MVEATSGKTLTAAVHQPHYFPWIPYMNKIAEADVFVVFDTVQLPRGKSRVLRAKYLDQAGEKWLTIPCGCKGDLLPIKDVRLTDDVWRDAHLAKLRNAYRGAPCFDWAMPRVEELLAPGPSLLLTDVLQGITEGLSRLLGLDTPFVRASDILDPGDMERESYLVALLEAVGARRYFTGRGRGTRVTVDEALFAEHGIEIRWQDFPVRPYAHFQGHDFVPQVSVLDALFNLGQDAAAEVAGSSGAGEGAHA